MHQYIYQSLISQEQKFIEEYNSILSKNHLNDFVNYFFMLAERNNFYENFKGCINDMSFIKLNYAYIQILEIVYSFYGFEKSNLQNFKPKENQLYDYFSSHNYDILSDSNYYSDGLITLTKNYEVICTKYLECKLYNKALNITIPLTRRMDNTLFEYFINLYNQGIIKQISFKPDPNTYTDIIPLIIVF